MRVRLGATSAGELHDAGEPTAKQEPLPNTVGLHVDPERLPRARVGLPEDLAHTLPPVMRSLQQNLSRRLHDALDANAKLVHRTLGCREKPFATRT